MGTRYSEGDIVNYGGQKYQVVEVQNPGSDSPDYMLGKTDGEYTDQSQFFTVKASEIRKSGGEITYGVGSAPAGSEVINLSFDEMEEKFPSLDVIADTVYRGERTESLAKLRNEGYEALAWTPNVRYLYYHPEKKLMLEDVEGDLYITKNPTDNTLEEAIQQFPMGEVASGEKYDSRFGSDRGVEPKWKREAKEELEEKFDTTLDQQDDRPNVGDSTKNGFAVWNGAYEFDVFKTRSDARRNAIESIKEDIERNPERFSDWVINDNVYMSKTDIRLTASDMQDSRMEILVEDEDMSWEEAEEETEDYREEVKKQLEKDPVGYFMDNFGYSRSTALENVNIDSQSAAEDVADNDGISLAIGIYGEVYDLSNGAVAFEVV